MTRRAGVGGVAGQLAIARGAARVPFAMLPLVILATNGASARTDCFFLVYSGVLLVANGIGPLLESAIVPFIADARATNSHYAFVNAVLRRSAMSFAPFSLALAAGAIVWHAGGWATPAGWEAGWRHLAILAGIPVTNAAASVLAGLLNAEEWFLAAALTGGLRGIVALAIGVAGTPLIGLQAYAVGLLAGEVAALAALMATVPGRQVLSARGDGQQQAPFWRLYVSLSAGGVANSSKGFVDRLVAASAGTGGVSIVEAAERVFLMAVSFLGAPLATVVLSRWSSAFAPGAERVAARLREAVRRTHVQAIGLGLALMLIYPVVGLPAVSSRLFGRFPPADVRIVTMTLFLYLAGATPYLLGLVTSQAILILRDSRFVATMAIVIAIANVPLDLGGMWLLGLPGIALGSSLLHLMAWRLTSWRLAVHAAEETRQA